MALEDVTESHRKRFASTALIWLGCVLFAFPRVFAAARFNSPNAAITWIYASIVAFGVVLFFAIRARFCLAENKPGFRIERGAFALIGLAFIVATGFFLVCGASAAARLVHGYLDRAPIVSAVLVVLGATALLAWECIAVLVQPRFLRGLFASIFGAGLIFVIDGLAWIATGSGWLP